MRDVIHEKYKMNILDMHTRENANKTHPDEMNRDANQRRLLGISNQSRDQKNVHPKRWLQLALTFAAVLFGLLAIAMRLI